MSTSCLNTEDYTYLINNKDIITTCQVYALLLQLQRNSVHRLLSLPVHLLFRYTRPSFQTRHLSIVFSFSDPSIRQRELCLSMPFAGSAAPACVDARSSRDGHAFLPIVTLCESHGVVKADDRDERWVWTTMISLRVPHSCAIV